MLGVWVPELNTEVNRGSRALAVEQPEGGIAESDRCPTPLSPQPDSQRVRESACLANIPAMPNDAPNRSLRTLRV